MAEVIIIGAGIAGLMAGYELQQSGIDVTVIEARDRIGGRIFTEENAMHPVELGAEFVHGRPPVLIKLLRDAGIETVESSGEFLLSEGGILSPMENISDATDEINRQIDLSIEQTYDEFLAKAEGSSLGKKLARSYVEGYNAADASKISAPSVAIEERASAAIEGGTQLRPRGGYHKLVYWLANQLVPGTIYLNTRISKVSWKHGECILYSAAGQYCASKVIITVPLGILKEKGDHGLSFLPEITEKVEAMSHLEMGHVVKVIAQFRDRFWEDPTVSGAFPRFGFAICPEAALPTWWTQQPLQTGVLTGWAGGPKAERLLSLGDDHIQCIALESLARVLDLPVGRMETNLLKWSFHNWSNDLFSLGAYSYPGLRGMAAARRLAEPVENTLYFAGEATDYEGFNGTVHGALMSAKRVSKLILSGSH